MKLQVAVIQLDSDEEMPPIPEAPQPTHQKTAVKGTPPRPPVKSEKDLMIEDLKRSSPKSSLPCRLLGRCEELKETLAAQQRAASPVAQRPFASPTPSPLAQLPKAPPSFMQPKPPSPPPLPRKHAAPALVHEARWSKRYS